MERKQALISLRFDIRGKAQGESGDDPQEIMKPLVILQGSDLKHPECWSIEIRRNPGTGWNQSHLKEVPVWQICKNQAFAVCICAGQESVLIQDGERIENFTGKDVVM